MEVPKTESIHSITWTSPAKSFVLYPSGFVKDNHGWYKTEDQAALQKLFDRAKEGLRSKTYEKQENSDISVVVWTTVAEYTFRGDLLQMKDAALPSNQPFEFEKDGHDERWSAMKTGSIIDARY